MEQTGRVRDLRQYVRTVQQRWKLVVSITLIGIVVGTLYVLSLPRIYEARSLVILLQPESSASSVLERIPGLASRVQASSKMSVETASNLVRSDTAAFEVARRLNAERRGKRNGTASVPYVRAEEVSKALAVEGVQPDQVFIRARSADRQIAMRIANETADVFLHLRNREAQTQVRERHAVVLQLLDRLDKDVRRLDRQVEDLLRGTMLFGEAGIGERLKSYYDLKHARDETSADMESAAARVRDLMNQLKKEGKIEHFKIRQEDPTLQRLQEKVDELEIRTIKAQAEYQPGADELLNLKEELDAARQRVEQARKERRFEVEQAQPNPHYQEVLRSLLDAQTQAALSRSRYLRFDEAVNAELRSLSDLPGQFQKLANLRRQGEAYAQARALLLTRKLDAEIEMSNPQKQATIGDRALTARPVAPRRLQLLLGVIVLSLGLGVGAAWMSQWMDLTVHTLEDATRATGVPCLGFIPDMGRRETMQQLVTHHNPQSSVSEAYRALRSALRYATMDKPLRTLLVTSATAGEGKTVTAANLAVSIADAGKRVVLVDADLRRPTQHTIFGKERTAGLTNVLAGDLEPSAALLRTDVENLMLLPSGPIPPNPAELLESPKMEETLNQLSELCDLVIVDVPPVLAVTDASALTSKVDAVLLVVMAGKAPTEIIAQAVSAVQQARGNVIGAVLNRVKVTRHSPYHYYEAYANGTRRQRVAQRGR